MADLRWVLVAGQMKAATTSLHAMLATHPDVVGTHPKESGWWQYPRMDAHRFRRLFAPRAQHEWIVDASVNATRPGSTQALASLGAMPPAAVVYVVRDEHTRIASHALHTFYHDRFPRTRRAAAACVDEAIAASDAAARLGPWLDTLPDTRFLALRYEDFVADPRAATRRLGEALGLDKWSPPAVHENDRSAQQPLLGPLRILPGRDRIIRAAKRRLGARSAALRRVVGGPQGIAPHPAITSALAARRDDIEAVVARNARWFAAEKRLRWV